MKKNTKKLLTLAALLALMVSLFSVPAAAKPLTECKVGEYNTWCIEQTPGEAPEDIIVSASVVSNNVPGMYAEFQSDAVFYSGTPTAAGTFTPTVFVGYQDGSSYTLHPTVIVAPADPVTPEYITTNLTLTVGSYSKVETAGCSTMIQSCYISKGSFPAGVSYNAYDTYLEILGTPTTPGNYSVVVFCDQTEGDIPVYFTVNITVNAAPKPRTVIQQPIEVTVEEGKSCQFSSSADGKGWQAWRFYKPDGTEVIFDVLKNQGSPYDQVKMTGGNSVTFKMDNVPLEMDGWSVACLFSLEGGDSKLFSYSNKVKIHVTPAPTPTPSEEPSPEPTEEPVATAKPSDTPVEATEAPVETVAPTAAPEPAPAKSNTGLIVALAVLSVGLIAAVVILLQKLKQQKGQ